VAISGIDPEFDPAVDERAFGRELFELVIEPGGSDIAQESFILVSGGAVTELFEEKRVGAAEEG
jgi:hypothetical protein